MAGGAVKVGVGAPPERGRATEEARRAIGEWLGIPSSHVRLASGATSRSKRFAVSGMSADALRGAVAASLGRHPS